VAKDEPPSTVLPSIYLPGAKRPPFRLATGLARHSLKVYRDSESVADGCEPCSR
jgi:hypothetical protein